MHRRLQARAYPGIARVIFCTHITRTRCEDTWHAQTPIYIYHTRAYAHTDIRIAYSVVTNYATIAHQIWRSKVLPGYPHSSAGTYGFMQYNIHVKKVD